MNEKQELFIACGKTIRKRMYRQRKQRKKKTFKWYIKIGQWRIYLTRNLRLKCRNKRDDERHLFDAHKMKMRRYETAQGKCERCGKSLTFTEAQMHHVLPLWKFPRFAMDERNLLILCHKCHKEIHTNPFLQAMEMQEKAKELDVDLSEHYKTQKQVSWHYYT